MFSAIPVSPAPQPNHTTPCDFGTLAERNTIWISTMIAAIFSLFGSSFMLMNYFTFAKRDRKGISSLINWIAFGDHIWSVSVIITYAILLYDPHMFTLPICQACRAVFQIGSASTLMWSLCASIYLFYAVGQEAGVAISTQVWIIFHLASWGVPSTIFFISLAAGAIQPSQLGICFPNYKWRLYSWFIPNAVIFISIAIFYLLTFLRIRRNPAYMAISQRFGLWRRLSFYLLVIFICWFCNFLAFFIFRENCTPAWVSLAYAMLLQLQGFFDAVIYGVSNKEFVQRYSGNARGFVVMLLISPLAVWPFAFPHFLYEWYQDYYHPHKKRITLRNGTNAPLINATHAPK